MKVKYLFTLVRGEALRQFDLLYAEMENKDISSNVDYLLKGLAWYFFSVDLLSKQNRAMRRCMIKPHRFKVKRYAARLSYLNDYLASFTGSTMTDKIGFTELNDILLNSMPNSWPKQVYVQGLY